MKWVFRELRNNSRFTILFILNMSLGLVGFIGLDTFKVSLNEVLQENSKNILAADFSLSARREIYPEELRLTREAVGSQKQESHLWEFLSMVNSSGGSRLVQVKAVEGNYPFYGHLKLGSGREINGESEKDIIKEMAIWVYPELLTQLQLKVGDRLRLGDAEYLIKDTVIDDSTQTLRFSSLAPKIYGGLEMIRKSNLVRKGTTFSDVHLFRLPPEVDVSALEKKIFATIKDPGVQVTTPTKASEDTGRALKYLSDYLGLVSLIALFLSGIGAAFLYRSFFSNQLKSMAILNTLGMSRARARYLMISQIFLMGLLAALIGAVVSLALFPLLRALLQEFSPVDVPLHLTLRIFLMAVLVATVGSFSISLPFLNQLGRIKTSQLFHEEAVIEIPWRIMDFAILLFPLGLFWILSIWQANSFRVGSLFLGMLLGSLVVILLLNWIFIQFTKGFFKRGGWILRYVGLQISRKQTRTLSCALALSLAALLINILPQLKLGIQKDLETPESLTLPALFLFDIQDEQAGPISEFLKTKNLTPSFSPMVRARILKVNDKDFEKASEESTIKTREEETEARFRNRGFNLSYRSQLDPSETVVQGEIWHSAFDASKESIPQISMEVQFAERLKFKIGDVLTFDVQGVEIQGKITSFRTVRWNSFKPNFFVLFQPGALEEAPKTFITSIAKSQDADVSKLQNDLVEKFPNVSMIDVGRAIQKILELLEKMSWSLQFMAGLCLVVGLLVLYSIVSHQVNQSRWDLNLLKILGSDTGHSLWSLGLEFLLISLISSLIGALLSFAVSAALSIYIFESPPYFQWQTPFYSVLGISFLSFLMAVLSARQVAQQRPQLILQS